MEQKRGLEWSIEDELARAAESAAFALVER
jgi:hypothetical protein